MSQPRRVLPGETYLLSRRCYDRTFFIRPSSVINQILLFCLALAAKKYDILVHAYCFMSNHFHVVATDPHGNLPEFMRWLDEFTAKCVNVVHGRWESIWSTARYSAVRCVDEAAVIDEMVYTQTNPVRARLVKSSRLWPGVISRTSAYGTTQTVERPNVFFRKNGPVPETVELQLVRPAVRADLSDAEFSALMREAVQAEEERLRLEARRRGQRFLGVEKVLATSPFDRPASRERRRRLNPHIACKDALRRAFELRQLRDFRREHRSSVERVRAGASDVVFPAGTYWMQRYLGVACAPAG